MKTHRFFGFNDRIFLSCGWLVFVSEGDVIPIEFYVNVILSSIKVKFYWMTTTRNDDGRKTIFTILENGNPMMESRSANKIETLKKTNTETNK